MKDYNDVLILWRSAQIRYRPNGRDSRARIENELKRGNTVFLVAAAGERLVGTAFGTYGGRKGWINRLAVDGKLRRQNIARRLVGEVERRLAEFGIDVFACLIDEDNHTSMRVFERLGYQKATDIAYFSKRSNPEA